MGRKGKVTIGEECPSCGATWGFDEMEQQSCFCCGYPDVNEDNYPEDEDDEDYDDYDPTDGQCGQCGLTGSHSLDCLKK